MAGYGYVRDALNKKKTKDPTQWMTVGRVVDTNDPQQMGRVRAFCPGFGDQKQLKIAQIPWAMYISPLGGVTSAIDRGAEQSPSSGPVAYGMWNIPKMGAYVLVGCIDGDSAQRFYAGCVQPQYMTHTMPHGRYTWNDQESGLPDGPLDTFENPIQPLYDNMKSQFTAKGTHYAPGTESTTHNKNMERRTRGVDNQVSAITNLPINRSQDTPGSKIADHAWGDYTFTTITEENGDPLVIKGPGYGPDQMEGDDNYTNTGGQNYDSMVYSWTTPGFHSFSMDDRDENARIRIRTTSGHQIIMDDTNERIYISAAGGETWIEIDKVGNIDIYAEKNVSTHAGGDINFTAGGTFRVRADEGIHFQTDDEYRLHARKDIHVLSEKNIRTRSVESTFMQAEGINGFHLRATSTLYLSSTTQNIDLQSQINLHFQSGKSTHILGGADIVMTGGPDIHLNGPQAEPAALAAVAAETQAFWTNRVPEHEPWARMFMNLDADQNTGNKHTPEYSYTDQLIGKGSQVRGETYTRNKLWHR